MGLGEFFSLSCALAWAVAVILSRKAGELMPPFALNLFKNTLMVALMVPTIILVDGLVWPDIPAHAVGLAMLSGMLGIGLGDTVFFRSLNILGASRAGVAGTMYSPWVVILSSVFLGQGLVSWQWGGMALVLGGVVLSSWPRRADASMSHHDARAGFAWAALAMFLMAVGIVTAKPLLEQYSFVWIVMLRMIGGLGFMLLMILIQGSASKLIEQYRRPHHWPTLFAAAFIGTYVAMLMWLAGYKYATAAVAAVLNESAAIATLFLARYWLKETLTQRQVLGASLAVTGVIVVVLV